MPSMLARKAAFVDVRPRRQVVLEPKMAHRNPQRVHAVQRRYLSLLMQRCNLFNQWQRRAQDIVGSCAVGFAPVG